MMTDCTECGLELGQLFVFIDRHTRLCLDCAEKITGAKYPTQSTQSTKPRKGRRAS